MLLTGKDARFGVCTDTGCVTAEMLDALAGCDAAVIEANHDVNMLRAGRYPVYLKRRILSDRGHLSNEACAQLACALAKTGVRSLVLGHLSRENNRPGLAERAVREALDGEGFSAVTLRVAPAEGDLELEVTPCCASNSICTGKLKESFYAAACEEYNKRLQRYCSPEIIELPETGDIKRDGAAMLARIGSGAFVVAMCIEGKGCSSEELASLMAQCTVQGKSRVCFLIGGSDGLSDEVKRAADVRLSMSRMTFPHHLARVMVLEQIYRAFNINEGGKYHK